MISQYFTAFDTIWIWKFSPLMFSWNSAPSRILWRVERAYKKKRRKTKAGSGFAGNQLRS
jgi:hypothetical protein